MSMASGTPSLGAAQAAKLLMEQQNAIAMLNAAQRGGDQKMALPQSSLSTVMEQQEQANMLSALNAARLAEGGGGSGVHQQRPGDASSASNSSPALSAQHNALAAFRAAQASNQSGGDSGDLSTNAPQNVASSNGNNGSNQLPALKILQLLEEHDRLEQQVKNQLALQNHIDRLRLENELKRQLLQDEVGNHDGQNRNSGQMMQQHMQTDMNIDQARILQEEVQRRARLQSEVQRALLNNMNAPNNSGGHPSNSGNQNQFMPP
uniref:Uncharacterized protein n=1 Tax=Chaetoceros debilis TaxID=122233 RepID=A0A7S3Q2J5_9STRA